MNKKGIFSGLLAVAAVALIAATILVSSAETRQISSSNISEQALQAKSELFNARYLLDKTLSDALVDAIPEPDAYINHCGSSPNYDVVFVCSIMEKYFRKTNDYYFSKNCSYDETSTNCPLGGAEVIIQTTISCSGNSAEIKLEKIVRTTGTDASCLLEIIDKQSGVVEASSVFTRA